MNGLEIFKIARDIANGRINHEVDSYEDVVERDNLRKQERHRLYADHDANGDNSELGQEILRRSK